MIAVSTLAASIQPSATLAAGAKARALRAAGKTVFDFSLGEPDQNTPAHIVDAALAAMRTGQTHYTPAAGSAEARKAVAEWYGRFHGYAVTPDRVVISNGAKHSIHNTLAVLVNPGDEVIIPTPYWVSYSDLVSMVGGVPVLVPTTAASGFKLSPEPFRAVVTPRTKLVMLNSPNNPSGATYTRAELLALVDAILETPCAVLSDEIYEQLCYGDASPTCVATLRPELPARTVTVSGASKSYAMTGWRMGWAVAPPHVAKAMDNLQSQETSCPSSVSQAALIAALTGPQECVAQMRAEYDRRRGFVCERLGKLPGVSLVPPTGAFYAFFDISAHFTPARPDSAAFCAAALEQAHVNLVPGSAFGCEGFVRMSFAASDAQLRDGLTALEEFLHHGIHGRHGKEE